MALIQINDKWRIKSDNYCWHIQRLRYASQETGEEHWEGVEYHRRLDSVPAALAEIIAKRSEGTSFGEIVANVREVLDALNLAVSKVDLGLEQPPRR